MFVFWSDENDGLGADEGRKRGSGDSHYDCQESLRNGNGEWREQPVGNGAPGQVLDSRTTLAAARREPHPSGDQWLR